jgi:hypothetical protein
MSFLDSRDPRNVLSLFYSSAFLSAILFGVGSFASVSYHRLPGVMAILWSFGLILNSWRYR